MDAQGGNSGYGRVIYGLEDMVVGEIYRTERGNRIVRTSERNVELESHRLEISMVALNAKREVDILL